MQEILKSTTPERVLVEIDGSNLNTTQSRLKQAGMRWDIENANGVAQLRNSYISGEWDSIWKKAA